MIDHFGVPLFRFVSSAVDGLAASVHRTSLDASIAISTSSAPTKPDPLSVGEGPAFLSALAYVLRCVVGAFFPETGAESFPHLLRTKVGMFRYDIYVCLCTSYMSIFTAHL
jgi:hypothetical protein